MDQVNPIPHKFSIPQGYLLVDGVYLANLERTINAIPKFVYLWHKLNHEQRIAVSCYLPFSKSQFAQDLFVISELYDKKINPYFVEFGATNGIDLSNTYLLETQLGWQGILAEPAKIWHESLKHNRHCAIDFRCVSNKTGTTVDFLEVLNPNPQHTVSSPELSSVKAFANHGDWASEIRVKNSIEYTVPTISLNDLLAEYNAPREIAYLSIDTEGGELMILQDFDFSHYRVHLITVEHNFQNEARNEIYKLLVSQGYQRKYEDISFVDDWYVYADD
ncbi:MAG: FkbM family methyltransferase [Snowella sp.]|nr:FkbM family methyltransferase [Snowella sp.]